MTEYLYRYVIDNAEVTKLVDDAIRTHLILTVS